MSGAGARCSYIHSVVHMLDAAARGMALFARCRASHAAMPKLMSGAMSAPVADHAGTLGSNNSAEAIRLESASEPPAAKFDKVPFSPCMPKLEQMPHTSACHTGVAPVALRQMQA